MARSGVDLLQQLVANLWETGGAVQRARIKRGSDVSSFLVAVNMETAIRAEVRLRQQIALGGQRKDRVVGQVSRGHVGPPGRLYGPVGAGDFQDSGSSRRSVRERGRAVEGVAGSRRVVVVLILAVHVLRILFSISSVSSFEKMTAASEVSSESDSAVRRKNL